MTTRGSYCQWFFCALLLTGCGKFGSLLDPSSKGKIAGIAVLAKVRDFHEGNATDKTGTHPHFEQNQGSCDAQVLGLNTVEVNLDTNGGSDPDFPGDNRGPKLIVPVAPALAKCFDPPERFSDWYEDRGPDTNRPFLINLAFNQDASTGNYAYENNKFFPIDKGEAFTKEKPDGPDPFGNLQTGSKDGVDLTQHDYGFTMEFHTGFTYQQGKGQFIAFEGDDDLWAFINGKRAVDLGGIHAAQRDTVRLDDLKDSLGLSDQGRVPLDFFFAERAVASSKLAIVTNVVFSSQ